MADGVTVTFDGIGASEDLIMILDLKDASDGSEITRAVLPSTTPTSSATA